MAANRQVYDSHHLQADCQEPGSAPPYARYFTDTDTERHLEFSDERVVLFVSVDKVDKTSEHHQLVGSQITRRQRVHVGRQQPILHTDEHAHEYASDTLMNICMTYAQKCASKHRWHVNIQIL